ncbi:MAG: cyclodeaminase/cyclohydrolase family protein [Tissierellia bacterium]|nr:cyclodeaminase/cyclohydrolase family protein [Tissierellia bacterium]
MELRNKSLWDFTKELASDAPAPGGGGVGALLASQGAALISMVCCLTMGKKKYAEYEDEILEMDKRAKENSQKALIMVDEDEENFLPLSKAYGLPKNTDEERNNREEIMEKALLVAMKTPQDTLSMCIELILDAKRLLIIGSKLVQSDVGVAAECILAAAKSSMWNMYINLKMLQDEKNKAALLMDAEEKIAAVEIEYNHIIEDLNNRLAP